MSAAFLCKLFRSSQQSAAELSILQIGLDAEKGEMPDAVFGRIQSDRSQEYTVGFIAVDQQMCRRILSQIFSQQRIIDALPLDDSRFDVPTGGRTCSAESDIYEVDYLWIVSFNGRLEQHSSKFTAPNDDSISIVNHHASNATSD